MKILILFLMALACFGQPTRFNPFTGKVDYVGVGGASAVAAGQVLYGTGAGVAGSENTFVWDAANDRLGLGTNAPQRPFHIRAAGGLRVDTASSGFDFTNSNTGEWQVTAVNSILRFGLLGTLWAHTTGNVTVGTTTDGNFRLDIGASGSSGTARIYDSTATTGSTSLVVRAGAGQSGNLTTWQNSGGGQVGGVEVGAFTWSGSTGVNKFQIYADGASNGLFIASDSGISWKASTNAATGPPELSIRRDSSTQVGIYGSIGGSYRDVGLRAVLSSGYDFASLPAATNGTFVYCSDCTIASPCASGGTGALAKRLNSTWVCN